MWPERYRGVSFGDDQFRACLECAVDSHTAGNLASFQHTRNTLLQNVTKPYQPVCLSSCVKCATDSLKAGNQASFQHTQHICTVRDEAFSLVSLASVSGLSVP